VKAVTLILKHATLLRTSHLPKAALTNVELDYQEANIDESIQQYLTACALDVSVEQFAGFIMGTEIGLFILLFFTSKSYCPFSVISVLSQSRCIDDTVS
jgi:F0F1-type ATP synthase assembly protein I